MTHAIYTYVHECGSFDQELTGVANITSARLFMYPIRKRCHNLRLKAEIPLVHNVNVNTNATDGCK